MGKSWHEVKREFIRANAHLLTDGQIAAILSRFRRRPVSWKTVNRVRVRLGIKKLPGQGRCEIASRPDVPPSGSL